MLPHVPYLARQMKALQLDDLLFLVEGVRFVSLLRCSVSLAYCHCNLAGADAPQFVQPLSGGKRDALA